MKLSENITVGEVKAQFRRNFPFLKIEFYSPVAAGGTEKGMNRISAPEVPLGLIRLKNINGYIRIDPDLNAAALEYTFQEIFGLNIKVFRRSFGTWVEAGKNETYSLFEQNLRGMKSSERALIV